MEKRFSFGGFLSKKSQLRPHIVWFGEEISLLDTAIEITKTADILIIIGTSMQVYQAAGLIHYTQPKTPIYFIDPNPQINQNQFRNLKIIYEVAGTGTQKLLNLLIG